jgi:polysaccharide chain length determinant protein (PEP-CTERM system associated)
MTVISSLRLIALDYLYSFWRRRWYAVGVAWCVCLLGWAVIDRIPDYYESSARIYMNSDEALTPLLRGIALDSDVDGRLDRLQRTLLSVTNMKKLIRMTDLDLRMQDSADRERMVVSLQKNIKIVMQTPNLFTVTYTDTDPQLAESVVSNLVSIFMEESAGDSRTDIDSAQRFMEAEIDRLEAELREDERRKAEFESRYYDLLPNSDTGLSQLEQARSDVENITQNLQDALAERDSIQKQRDSLPQFDLAATKPAVDDSHLSVSPQIRLSQLQAQLEIAKATMTDRHPVVIALKHQISLVTAKLNKFNAQKEAAQKTAMIENPVYRELTIRLSDKETEIASLRRRLASAEQNRDKIEDEARKEPTVAAQYLNLNRDYGIIKKSYEELLARRESARIAENAERTGNEITVRMIDPPEVPVVPSGPNRPLYLSLAFLAGIGSGIGVALVLGQIDSSFTTITALQQLGFPVLGSIRRLEAFNASRRSWFIGTKIFISACLMLLIAYSALLVLFIGAHRADI